MTTWKQIADAPLYRVSDHGDVAGPRGALVPYRMPNGYVQVTLGFGKGSGIRRGKKCYVHRLVAAAFLDNPLQLPQAHHRDGDRANNRVSNLEWASVLTNQHAASYGDGNRPHVLTPSQVAEVKRLSASGMRDADIARKLCTGRKYVAMVLIGKRWVGTRAAAPPGDERWAECARFAMYEVSTHGRVRRDGRVLVPVTNKQTGYIVLSMRRDGVTYQSYVHRLVALTFFGDPPADMRNPRVDHLNGNRAENHVGNLQWVSHAQNIRRRYREEVGALLEG